MCNAQRKMSRWPLAGVVFFLGMEDAGAASASKSKNVIS
jgi:hypothetical protein